MKKFKIINNKWLVIVLIAAGLLVFSFLDEQRSIAGRSIVLAVTLDKMGSEYEMGIQVLKTDKSEKQEYINYFDKGESLSDVIDKLSTDTGGTVSLCHSLVIILSQNVLDKDNDVAMKYFFENEILCNNTMVVTAKESPKELLTTKLSNGIGSGYYLGQTLRKMGKDFGIIPMTIKDYFMNRFRIGSCVYLPCVGVEQQGETSYLNISESYVGNNEKSVILSEEATKGLSIVLNSIDNGTIPYVDGEIMGEMDIVKCSSKLKIEGDDKALIQVTATLKNSSVVPNKIDEQRCKEFAEKKIKEYVEACYEQCKEQGLDVFYVGQHCYAYKKPICEDSEYLDKVGLDIKSKISLK